MTLETLPSHIQQKIRITGSCWMWEGTLTKGYGAIRVGRKMKYAHRVVYELLVGPILEGLTIDHLCRVPACINPDHLEPVTIGENTRRVSVWPQSLRTHCPQSHPYDEENTYVNDGKRECRECKRTRQRARNKTPKWSKWRKEYLKQYRLRKKSSG